MMETDCLDHLNLFDAEYLKKIIIKHNCFKFKHSNNRYRKKKTVIFFENVAN